MIEGRAVNEVGHRGNRRGHLPGQVLGADAREQPDAQAVRLVVLDVQPPREHAAG